MNKSDAKTIAKTISNQDLHLMFLNAKEGISDWTQQSSVNKGMTKGSGWNILAKDFKLDVVYSNLAKVNMIREFGDYLPERLKVKKTKKPNNNTDLVHSEPNFDNWL